jgi:hypothetical protein
MNIINRYLKKMNIIPAESPEIATRFESILNFSALFSSRIYLVTFIQSSRPAGKGCSGARRYLYIQIQLYSDNNRFKLTQQK